MLNVLKVNSIDTKTTSFVNVILVPFLFILNLLNSAFLYFNFGYVTAYRDCPRHCDWLITSFMQVETQLDGMFFIT